ncbi:MAG: hypothetical protein P4L69_07145 [Desulfosporosinus sp.]|nr:hypothetical protein [Desulfosporosinus sp.]
MNKTAIIVGSVVIVAAVGLGIGVAMYQRKPPVVPPTKDTAVVQQQTGGAVSTSWGTPRAVGGVKDSLGLAVYPEMYELGRLDKQDACAWQGCIGMLDANGMCTGCPDM